MLLSCNLIGSPFSSITDWKFSVSMFDILSVTMSIYFVTTCVTQSVTLCSGIINGT